MSLKSVHPEYSNVINVWQSMRDFYLGERVVKEKGVTYLPPTQGMILDGMGADDPGYKSYLSYKSRAIFPDYVKEGVEALIGLLHQKDAQIELPESMEYLRNSATINGESILLLLRKINEEQLVPGRCGLLVDLPVNPDQTNPRPFISLYSAESIHNWDDGSNQPGVNELNLVVLNESANIREDFEWTFKEKYRVLQLGALTENEEGATYKQGVFEQADYVESAMMVPTLRGTPLRKIPFTFVNSKDLISSPDVPPLVGLGQTCLSIYRSEADYRQNLHMQGQDTLVTVGGLRNPSAIPGRDEDAVRVGAGSRIDVDLGGDAKFIGVSSTGLSEQRNAIENDRKRAEFKASQMIGNQSDKNVSGNAMLARLAAQTANLNQIALSSAEGLQVSLRFIAEWLGEDPSKVRVTPNTEFTNAAANAQELVYLMTARNLGAPLSMKSIHTAMKDRGYTQMDFENERKLVAKEGSKDKRKRVAKEGLNGIDPKDPATDDTGQTSKQQ